MTSCEAFRELAESSWYTALIGLKFLVISTGAILTAIQWRVRGTRWLRHENTRTLFTFYYPLIITIGACYAALYGFEFVRLRFPCWRHDFRYVLAIRTCGLSAISSSQFLMSAISLERLYSTVFPHIFEKLKGRIFAISIASLIIFTCFAVTFTVLTNGFTLFWTTKYVATIDLRVDENANVYSTFFACLLYTYVPTSLIFLVDWFMNFVIKWERKEGDLNVTYQRKENRDVIAALIPLEIIYAIYTNTATVAQFVYMTMDVKGSFIERALLVEGTALSPLYPLTFVLIVEWRLRKMNQAKVVPVLPPNTIDDHFRQLDELFGRVPRRESAPVV